MGRAAMPWGDLLREVAGLGPWAVRWPAGLVVRDRRSVTTVTGVDDGPLVVLVHGLAHNRSAWTSMAGRLSGTVVAVNVDTFSLCVPQLVARVGEVVRRHTVHTPGRPVHLVGHSLGGIVVRQVALHRDLAAAVTTVATLGAPHQGTPVADVAGLVWRRRLWGGRTVAQLRTDGLAAQPGVVPASGRHIGWLNVRGGADGLVPADHARLDLTAADGTPVGVRDVLLDGVSHMGLLTDPRVVAAVRQLQRDRR